MQVLSNTSLRIEKFYVYSLFQTVLLFPNDFTSNRVLATFKTFWIIMSSSKNFISTQRKQLLYNFPHSSGEGVQWRAHLSIGHFFIPDANTVLGIQWRTTQTQSLVSLWRVTLNEKWIISTYIHTYVLKLYGIFIWIYLSVNCMAYQTT